MTPAEATALQSLLTAATPFLHITGATRADWCRVMQNPKDKRIGPWKYTAQYEVLNQQVWDRQGEVIYFVTDESKRLRLVGQSMSKLNFRWKCAPMYDVKSQRKLGRKALFHTSSWPAIEAGFMGGEPPPFTVSALFRDRFDPLCRSCAIIANAIGQPETHLQRLSFHLETWVCSLDYGLHPLWNKQKVKVYQGPQPTELAPVQ